MYEHLISYFPCVYLTSGQLRNWMTSIPKDIWFEKTLFLRFLVKNRRTTSARIKKMSLQVLSSKCRTFKGSRNLKFMKGWLPRTTFSKDQSYELRSHHIVLHRKFNFWISSFSGQKMTLVFKILFKNFASNW